MVHSTAKIEPPKHEVRCYFQELVSTQKVYVCSASDWISEGWRMILLQARLPSLTSRVSL